MGSPLRAAVRTALFLGWTLLLIPAQALALVFHQRLARRIPVFYHRNACRMLGIHVAPRGTMSTEHPTLFVCNHSSYLDITVLASLIEGSFVSKAEVAGWPLFGLLAKLQRTVFIERRPTQAAQHRDEIGRRLDDGDNLFLFPEGTSTDGNRVKPFRSALFAVAEREVRGRPLAVQPVSIAYTRLDGIPLGRALRPLYTWFGDMELGAHMWTMASLGALTVEVEFHPPVTFAQFGSRKALATHCYEAVATGHAALNAGLMPVARKRRLLRRPVAERA
jgi:1-acyl-sn-glycerol-3-phosphate acyltransferase